MRSLRVLHVSPYSGEAWAYGGIPRVVSALARALGERGHCVTVCTTDACDARRRLGVDGRPSRLRAWSPLELSPGVTLRVFPNVSNRLAYQQLFVPIGFGAYLRRHAGTFDVAHLHACRNLPGVIAARHLERAGIPYVITPNGTAPRIERRHLAKRVFDAALGWRVMRRAARVVAVSEAERVQFDELGIPPDAVRLVANPVDFDEFGAPAAPAAIDRPLSGRPLTVLYLGRLSRRKRLDVVVRAFARLRHQKARLVIAGNDMGAAAAARTIAAAEGVAHRTVFTGLLKGPQRLEALAAADVLVYPAEHEIFGLVPLEAMLCGTPAIVADDSGCAEVVRRVDGGIAVPVGDAERLAGAIEVVLADRDAWRERAARAADRARRLYAPDIVSAHLEEVYRELVPAA